jgi:hypothetical protein
MAIGELTVKAITLELARLMGDLAATGTATSGTTGRLDDSTVLRFEEANEVEGSWVAIYEGAAVGDERNIATYVVGDTRITPRANFSATIDDTSKYIITKNWRPQQYIDAIAAAVRRVQHRHLLPLDGMTGNLHEQITFGDLLSADGNANGQFEDTSGTFPTGWTIDGNTTMSANTAVDTVRRGRSSARMISDGSNLAKISQSIKYFDRHAGHVVQLRAWSHQDGTNRTLIRIGDGGVSTAVTATHADGTHVWEELVVDLTMSSEPKGLDIDLEISAGDAVSAFWDDVRLICLSCYTYEYDIPSRLVFLADVQTEVGSATGGSLRESAYENTIPRRAWRVEGGSSPRLILNHDYFVPPRNRHVRLRGQAHPASITAATPATAWPETVEANPEFVKAWARYYLWSSYPPDASSPDWRLFLREARFDAAALEDELDSTPWPGSVRVQQL